MKYTFNNKVFKNKKDVDVYIRSIKKEIVQDGESLVIGANDKWFDFLMEIVNVHNDKVEKIGIGISYFYFVKDKFNNDQLRIVRKDLSTIDCSCMYSKITQQDELRKYNNNLNSALRNAVKEQIISFKNNQKLPLKCSQCGDTNNCEVDHVKPFHYIRSEFLKTANKDEIPLKFKDDVDDTCMAVFESSDNEFVNKWAEFHRDNASYQILCKTCNRKKGCKSI